MSYDEFKRLKDDIDRYVYVLKDDHPYILDISDAMGVLLSVDEFYCLIGSWVRGLDGLLELIARDIEKFKNYDAGHNEHEHNF